MPVEVCVRCERFARIEPHEAGYTMLCRSTDVEVEESPSVFPLPRAALDDD